MAYRIAVIGAPGLVGREVLGQLAQSGLPIAEVVALSGGRAGTAEISFGERVTLRTRALDGFDFSAIALAIFAGPPSEAAHALRAAEAGAFVLDATPRHRLEPGVPLWLPEQGAAPLKAARRRIVALPDPLTIQLLRALTPLDAAVRVSRLTIVSCESCAGVGKEAMDELFAQTRAVFVNDPATPEHLPRPIAFNVIPQVERLLANGEDAAEERLQGELRKLVRPELTASVTRLRVPVFLGHGMAVHAGFEQPLPERSARAALRHAPGVTLYERREDGAYATPIEIAGEDLVHVARLRADPGQPNGLAFWCVADNVRLAAGGITAAAELAHREGLLNRGT
jgi:aspartate-semialdehyde dehydrogenase